MPSERKTGWLIPKSTPRMSYSFSTSLGAGAFVVQERWML